MHQQTSFTINTPGRGSYDITRQVQEFVQQHHIKTGMCNIFVHHTSASLILCENADPQVRDDLETFMAKKVPDGDAMFLHTDEGADDMSAHVRTVLTASSLSIPITNNRCALGTWQGIYLWEHRTAQFTRKITVTIYS